VDEGGDKKLGLTLNEVKTPANNAQKEASTFLGYTLGPRLMDALRRAPFGEAHRRSGKNRK